MPTIRERIAERYDNSPQKVRWFLQNFFSRNYPQHLDIDMNELELLTAQDSIVDLDHVVYIGPPQALLVAGQVMQLRPNMVLDNPEMIAAAHRGGYQIAKQKPPPPEPEEPRRFHGRRKWH